MHLPLAGAIVQAKLPVQGLVSFLHAATKGETVMHDDDADNDADDDDDDDDDSKGSAPTAKKLSNGQFSLLSSACAWKMA